MHFYARPTFVLINPSIAANVGFDVFRNGIAFLASTITYKCISPFLSVSNEDNQRRRRRRRRRRRPLRSLAPSSLR